MEVVLGGSGVSCGTSCSRSSPQQSELFAKNVVARATLDTSARNLEVANQSYTGAKASEERARLAYSSEIGGVNTQVARLQAELNDAQYDLDQTVVRAPANGFVTQVALQPGVYVVPLPLKPAMKFGNCPGAYLISLDVRGGGVSQAANDSAGESA